MTGSQFYLVVIAGTGIGSSIDRGPQLDDLGFRQFTICAVVTNFFRNTHDKAARIGNTELANHTCLVNPGRHVFPDFHQERTGHRLGLGHQVGRWRSFLLSDNAGMRKNHALQGILISPGDLDFQIGPLLTTGGINSGQLGNWQLGPHSRRQKANNQQSHCRMPTPIGSRHLVQQHDIPPLRFIRWPMNPATRFNFFETRRLYRTKIGVLERTARRLQQTNGHSGWQVDRAIKL